MSYRSLLTLLLATTALAGPARAQDGSVQLNEISVEAASPGNSAPGLTGSGGLNVSGGDGGTASTSGGGGGPSGITGYTARVATTATKTNTPLIETPQSITVVGRQQLDTQNAQTLTQATQYVAGTYAGTFGADTRLDFFQLRGRSTTSSCNVTRNPRR